MFNKAYKIRDCESGEERKAPGGGDLLAMAHVGEITKGPADLDRSFWMVASDQTLDRDGDVIRAKGWNLKNFRKNPVGLWMHQYRELPVFRVPEIKVDGDKLMALMHFPEELGGLSNDVHEAFKAKVLNASSVGFGVDETMTDPKKREEYGLPSASDSWTDGILFWKQELWELSAVTVPSNPEALAQIKSMEGIETLKEMLQKSEDFVIEINLDDTTDDPPDEPEDVDSPADDPADDAVPDTEELSVAQMTEHLEGLGYTIQPPLTDDGDDVPDEISLTIEPEPDEILEITPELAATISERLKEIKEKQIRQIVADHLDYMAGRIKEKSDD